jgi:bacterioferritin-associated ferredoxin
VQVLLLPFLHVIPAASSHVCVCQATVDAEVKRQMQEAHERAKANEARLQQSHREAVQQMARRHGDETEAMLARYQNDLDHKHRQAQKAQQEHTETVHQLQDQVGLRRRCGWGFILFIFSWFV